MHKHTVGERIRSWRRRRGGMSQKTLADLAGLSQAYISQIESGQRPLDRRSTQTAIAQALNVSVTQLLGRPTALADPLRDRAVAHVPAIRSALVELAAGERDTPAWDREQVRAAVREATDLRNGAEYAALAPRLPRLLRELAAHGPELAPELVETLFGVRYALRTMGSQDLAWTAAELGVRTAEAHGDPAWIAQARYSWVQALPPESAELGSRVLDRAADELQSCSTRGAREVYGCLHILAGFQAAIANRTEAARDHLAEAGDIAGTLGEPTAYTPLSAGFNGNWFGPTQVEYWRVAVAAEFGDTGAALSVADRIDLTAVPVPNRHVYYWTDLGRALAAGGQDREAMHALGQAERSAPEHFRFSPVARDLVAILIARAKRRAVGTELATLARRLGLEPV